MPITAVSGLFSTSAAAAGSTGEGGRGCGRFANAQDQVPQMQVDPEVSTLLSAPVIGGSARALCGALQAPDVHGSALREALEAFVRDAQARALTLAEVRHALALMVRTCARTPRNDRAGVTEYVLRRATVLYESSFSAL